MLSSNIDSTIMQRELKEEYEERNILMKYKKKIFFRKMMMNYIKD